MFKIIIIGFVAGLINGMFSTGGGMILVPSLIYILKVNEKKARGTSIACILFFVITNSLYYYKEGYIDWKISILVAIGGIIGGILGAIILKRISIIHLKIIFIIFLINMAFKFIFF